MENVLSIGKRFPLNTHAGVELDYNCSCVPGNLSLSSPASWGDVSVQNCHVSWTPPLHPVSIEAQSSES